MFYDAQLEFLRHTLKKISLRTILFSPSEPASTIAPAGLRDFFADNLYGGKSFYELMPQLRPNTFFKMTDPMLRSYIFCLLPETEEETVLFIGPYLREDVSQANLMKVGERFSVPAREIHRLEEYYASIPVLPETRDLFFMVDSFGELIWGDCKNFSWEVLDSDMAPAFSPVWKGLEFADIRSISTRMDLMEQRCFYENELMRAVASGQTHKIPSIAAGFSALPFGKSLEDPVRNARNYCIIMNTLLRKAAEQGGVHPLHVDSLSSDYGKKIEALNSEEASCKLMEEMFLAYCNLVKKYSLKNYSRPIQKAITIIDSDLAADLSLRNLASLLNISDAYLSHLFRRETGRTLTDFVNSRRIELAGQLLTTTRLQIQTIAQHCGIADVQYFSKLFKKYTGLTPKEYRNL